MKLCEKKNQALPVDGVPARPSAKARGQLQCKSVTGSCDSGTVVRLARGSSNSVARYQTHVPDAVQTVDESSGQAGMSVSVPQMHVGESEENKFSGSRVQRSATPSGACTNVAKSRLESGGKGWVQSGAKPNSGACENAVQSMLTPESRLEGSEALIRWHHYGHHAVVRGSALVPIYPYQGHVMGGVTQKNDQGMRASTTSTKERKTAGNTDRGLGDTHVLVSSGTFGDLGDCRSNPVGETFSVVAAGEGSSGTSVEKGPMSPFMDSGSKDAAAPKQPIPPFLVHNCSQTRLTELTSKSTVTTIYPCPKSLYPAPRMASLDEPDGAIDIEIVEVATLSEERRQRVKEALEGTRVELELIRELKGLREDLKAAREENLECWESKMGALLETRENASKNGRATAYKPLEKAVYCEDQEEANDPDAPLSQCPPASGNKRRSVLIPWHAVYLAVIVALLLLAGVLAWQNHQLRAEKEEIALKATDLAYEKEAFERKLASCESTIKQAKSGPIHSTINSTINWDEKMSGLKFVFYGVLAVMMTFVGMLIVGILDHVSYSGLRAGWLRWWRDNSGETMAGTLGVIFLIGWFCIVSSAYAFPTILAAVLTFVGVVIALFVGDVNQIGLHAPWQNMPIQVTAAVAFVIFMIGWYFMG